MPSNRKPKQSKQFRELERSLNKIEKNLLPKIRTDGSYTEREKLLVRSYRLLAHAEFEYYFEKIAESIIIQAHVAWVSNRKASNVLTSLASFSQTKTEIPKNAFSSNGNPNRGASFEERLIFARRQYIKKLNENNGIREKDLLKILLPLGLSIYDVDNTWLNSIDSFGSKRGAVAHCSIKVQYIIDPATERNEIRDILEGIRELDQKICCLK